MTIYSDLNQFTPNQQSLVVDLNSVYQSITNILSTPTNTRLFLPEFGSQIEQLLFEPMDDETVAAIMDSIIIAINKWEPRVDIDYSKSSVTPDYDKYTYYVYLTFKIRGLSDNNFYTYRGTLNKQ